MRNWPLKSAAHKSLGARGDRWHDAGVRRGPAAAPFLDQAMAGEEIAGRTDRRPRARRVSRGQPLQQLLRPPIRMLAPRREEQLRHWLGDLVRAVMRRPTPIPERRPAARVVARQPFVAGLPADGVAGAEPVMS